MFCPICGSTETAYIGVLGLRTHCRCRDCMAEYSFLPDPTEGETEQCEEE